MLMTDHKLRCFWIQSGKLKQKNREKEEKQMTSGKGMTKRLTTDQVVLPINNIIIDKCKQ